MSPNNLILALAAAGLAAASPVPQNDKRTLGAGGLLASLGLGLGSSGSSAQAGAGAGLAAGIPGLISIIGGAGANSGLNIGPGGISSNGAAGLDLCITILNCGFLGIEIKANAAYYVAAQDAIACATGCKGDKKCASYSVQGGTCRRYAVGADAVASGAASGSVQFWNACCPVPSKPSNNPAPPKYTTPAVIVTTTKATAPPAYYTTTAKTTTTSVIVKTTTPAAPTTIKTTPAAYTTSPAAYTTVKTTPAAYTTTTKTAPAAYTTPAASSSTVAPTTTSPASAPTAVCSVKGWDKQNPAASIVDSSGSYNTFAACKSLAIENEGASFAFGGQYCLVYSAVAGNNVAVDAGSPYTFYDMGCAAPPPASTTAATPTTTAVVTTTAAPTTAAPTTYAAPTTAPASGSYGDYSNGGYGY